MPIVGYILTLLIAYLLGSIPTGFLLAKARGVDIRTVGSGNIGATNVLRAAGKKAAQKGIARINALMCDGCNQCPPLCKFRAIVERKG